MQTLHIASKQSSGTANMMNDAYYAWSRDSCDFVSDECREKIFTFLQARDEIMRVFSPPDFRSLHARTHARDLRPYNPGACCGVLPSSSSFYSRSQHNTHRVPSVYLAIAGARACESLPHNGDVLVQDTTKRMYHDVKESMNVWANGLSELHKRRIKLEGKVSFGGTCPRQAERVACSWLALHRHLQAKELAKKLAYDMAKGEKKGKTAEQIMQRYADKLYELEQQMADVQAWKQNPWFPSCVRRQLGCCRRRPKSCSTSDPCARSSRSVGGLHARLPP
jgi:hypothetical protein